MSEKKYSLEEMVREKFEANKQRGKYLAFIVKELDEAGFTDFDEVLKKAIFKFGKDKSKQWGKLNADEFMHHLIDSEVAEETMKFSANDNPDAKRAEFTFGRCPLEEGWKEMGLSDAERKRLCEIASEHDYGIVANDERLSLDMPEKIGTGDPVCRLIVKKQ
jgi:hypothetical protein